MLRNPSVTIDAAVLAVPLEATNAEEAYAYVEALLDWSQLLDDRWASIYMSERASESLFADGLYPLRDQLNQLFERFGVVEYDFNTVSRIPNELLSLTPTFESCYGLKDVWAEPCETHPDILSLTSGDALQSDLARCAVLIAILKKHCSQPLGGHSLVVRNAPRSNISVRAQINDIEHLRDDIPALPLPPDLFEGEIIVCDNFNGLVLCVDEAQLLTEAPDNVAIDLAIKIALYKHQIGQGSNTAWTEVITPSIGRKFRETCQKCCSDQDASLPSRILRSIVETMNNLNLADVHALRSGRGGGDPQMTRFEDKAQRRDIDREFHLHYWECADGSIELGSVVYHNDFSIPR